MSEFWHSAAQLSDLSKPFVVVTLLSAEGHIPQNVGAKAVVTADGLHQGTVGGGKIEARAIEYAKEMLRSQKTAPQMLRWNLTKDLGMTCGGEAQFLFEKHNPKHWNIVVYGAGHVSQALCRVLERLDCHLTCVDSRNEWLDELPKTTKITKILSEDLTATVDKMDPNSFFVVMTRGHATDLPVVEKILKCFPDSPYVGVMGSDVKAKKVRGELLAMGISAEVIARLHSPIGLDVGGNAPFEIAISVVAQLLHFRKIWEEKTAAAKVQNAL